MVYNMRTTKAQLENLVRIINNNVHGGILERSPMYLYSLDYAYGGVRLVYANGSRDISPRLSRGKLYDWLHAFKAGQESIER
jgi:hypothetical protein